MLAFDLAREGNPAAVGGSATGLANTGGFTMAVATQLIAGRLLDTGWGDGIPSALLPMLALMGLALVMSLRLGRRAARVPAGVGAVGPRAERVPTPA